MERFLGFTIWVVVKIMVPFWVLNIVRPIIQGTQKRTLILTTTHLGVQMQDPVAQGLRFGGFGFVSLRAQGSDVN